MARTKGSLCEAGRARRAAKRAGRGYYIGKSCKRGHHSQRRVSDAMCMECSRLARPPEQVPAVFEAWRRKKKIARIRAYIFED